MEQFKRFSSNRRSGNYGHSRNSYHTGNSRGRRRGGNGSRYNKGQSIDINKFIKKVEAIAPNDEYQSTFKFADLAVNQILKNNIEHKGFSVPTPVQDQSIPHIMKGEDLLGIANTGTGKTGAFLIPLFQKIINKRNEKVLIIVPTRELAEQINDEFPILSRNLRIFSVACIGGNYIGKQLYQLKKGYNFVIGTPGRLIDLNKRGELNMAGFSTIVLDEVDRMLEMGFVEDIKFLIGQLPQERQSLFFSATLNSKVENVINLLLKKRIHKSISQNWGYSTKCQPRCHKI